MKALHNEYTIFPLCVRSSVPSAGGCRCCCLVIDIAQPENMRPIEECKAGWLSLLSDRQEMACSRAVAQRRGLKESKVPLMSPAGVIKPPATAETSGYPCFVASLFLRGRWRVNELWERAWANFQSPHMIREPREEAWSGIWRKVDPQRQAECEVKRDACCDCNSGHIHFPVPHSYALIRFPDLCSGWNLGWENGSLKP